MNVGIGCAVCPFQLDGERNFGILRTDTSEAGKLLEFISFCVEMYAVRKTISGQDAYSLFNRLGVLDYLERNYEPLHTQGFNYILSSVDDFMAGQEAK